MHQRRKLVCEKLKFKITVYFVIGERRLILNIVSTKLQHKNINKHRDRDAFDLQNIKRVGKSFYILTIFILNFQQITLSFICLSSLYNVVIQCSLLKYIAVAIKLPHNSLSLSHGQKRALGGSCSNHIDICVTDINKIPMVSCYRLSGEDHFTLQR